MMQKIYIMYRINRIQQNNTKNYRLNQNRMKYNIKKQKYRIKQCKKTIESV